MHRRRSWWRFERTCRDTRGLRSGGGLRVLRAEIRRRDRNGLIFLLGVEEQRRLIARVADILEPGGRLLFTASAEALVWNDAMTELESRSLGAVEYRSQPAAAGLSVIGEYDDERENHYLDALKKRVG